MENQNYVGNNLTKLPPGLRFHPTDEEILFEYLRCKVFNLPLPASVIPQVEFLEFDPWDLPGNNEEMRYFFCKKKEAKASRKQKKSLIKWRCNSNDGYWKGRGSTKQISAPQTPNNNMGMMILGLKNSFVFYQGKPPKGRRTDWCMHEYALHFNGCEDGINVEEWVICKVFKKQRSERAIVYEDSTSSSLHEDEYCDNFYYHSTPNHNNSSSSPYYCHSPTSSSSTSSFHSNYYGH